MKRYLVAHLPILIFAFAMTPAAQIPAADATTIGAHSEAESPNPIEIYTRPTEREKLRLYGERTASNFGIQIVTTTSRYGLAEILREDTAYYRCLCGGLFPRLGHALISTVAGRHGEDGHMTFSIPGLVSPYAGTMTALAWYPGRYGVKDGFRMGNYNLLDQAIGNLVREFIYGGPHTLFHGVGRSRSPDQPAEARNP